jgi:2-phosphosulfolactate phosphatase
VLCADSIERAAGLRLSGRVLAGERRCVKPEGFDQGNSPAEARERRGDELVLATTNGAPAIVAAAASAPWVLLGSLLNLGAVAAALLERADPATRDILIVCSGTEGGVAVEDTYVAGRLSAGLPGPRTDAARVAEGVARAFRSPLEALAASAGAHLLEATGLSEDISYCSLESRLDVVPVTTVASAGVAVVVPAGRSAPHRHAGEGVDDVGTVRP